MLRSCVALTLKELCSRPARRGGQRRYSQSDVLRVADVSKMADEGLTLAGIRRIMALQAQVHELQRQLTSKRGQP